MVMMHDVFISYSSKDASFVDSMCRILETNGIKCWVAPRNIPTSSNYAREIPAAIRGCTVFLLVMSPDTQSSIWVSRELDLAINERKVIFPLMTDDISLNDEFNFYLTGVQRYYAYAGNSKAMEILVRNIKALLGVKESVSAKLRCDGYYYTEPNEDKQRMYYRFFPNGKLVTCSSSGDPVPVSKWLNESYNQQEDYSVTDSEVRFVNHLWNGHRIEYRGKVRENALDLVGYSTYAGRNFDYPCTFISLAEIAEEEKKPKGEIIDIRVIDPRKPARLEETKLRYDGFYCTDYSMEAVGKCRSYYRFYPNGVVASAYTLATPAQALKWLNSDQKDCGRAIFDGQTLRLDEPLSDGKHYFAKLTLDGDRLFMNGINTFTETEMRKECTFLPFSEINE